MSEDPRKHMPTLETFRRVMDRRAAEENLRKALPPARAAPTGNGLSRPANGSAGGHKAALHADAARGGRSWWTPPRKASVAVAAVLSPVLLMYVLLVRPREHAAESPGAVEPAASAAAGAAAAAFAAPEATPGAVLGEAPDSGMDAGAAADAAMEAGGAAGTSAPAGTAAPTPRNSTLPAHGAGKISRSGEGIAPAPSGQVRSSPSSSPVRGPRRPINPEPPPGGRTPEF